MGDARLVDHMIQDGLWCAWEGHHMGHSAEAIAARHGVDPRGAGRLESAQPPAGDGLRPAGGAFRDEIVPVEIPGRRGPIRVDTDECPRPDTSAGALGALRPVFSKDGTVTAGNSSAIADGTAALVLTWGRAPPSSASARWRATSPTPTPPSAPLWLFEAPAPTIERLLERTGTPLDDYDLMRLNEAFTAQVVADGKLLGWDDAG